jgi:hypothetical protein
MHILGYGPSEIANLADWAVGRICNPFKLERDSGYLTIFDDATGKGILLICMIRICPSEKAGRYLVLSQEKASRLSKSPSDISSYQTRDATADKWGGAVRAGSIVISFSGLPELADEAVSVYVARRMGLMDKSQMQKVANISGNRYIEAF